MVYFQQFAGVFVEKTKEILSHLNWVDLIGVAVVTRTIYFGLKKGLLIEIFKFLAFGVGVFTAVTQYKTWGAFLSERSRVPLRESEVFAFLAIFAVIYWISFLLRHLFVKVATVQIRGVWDRMAGGVLGFCRGCAWMIFLAVMVLCWTPATGYLAQSIRERSFFGPSLLKGGGFTYQIANQFSTSFAIEKFERILQEEQPPPTPQKTKESIVTED